MAAAAASAVIITKMREANQPNALDQAKLFEGEMEKLNPPRDSFPTFLTFCLISPIRSPYLLLVYYLIILLYTSAMFYQSLIR